MALDELTDEEKREFFAGLDTSTGGKLGEIAEQDQFDAMNAALIVLGVFVLSAFGAALFLPRDERGL